MAPPKIEIIGTVAGELAYHADQIVGLLSVERTTLEHGEQFTGRPGTALHVSGRDVVKLRLDATQINPRVWLQRTLDVEQVLQVHHPLKTWFLLRNPDDRRFLTGNICPLLAPLHTFLPRIEPAKLKTQGVAIYKTLFHTYFRAYAAGWRLDLGLSNFGLDQQGKLYYLDDDIYSGNDGFTDFAHMVGVYVRSQSWLDAEAASALGQAAAGAAAQEGFSVLECLAVSERLTAVFVPEGRASAAMGAFVQAFVASVKSSWQTARPVHPQSPETQAGLRIAEPRGLSGRYVAILSDVHANYPALRAVMDFLASRRIRGGVVIGDVVGYGPHPAQCVELLAESGFVCIKGNHDEAMALPESAWRTARSMMSRDARWVVEWSRPMLGAAHLGWLSALPLTAGDEDWVALHGAPVDPQVIHGYVYEMTFGANLDELKRRAVRFCFHGHTHLRGIYGRVRGRPDGFCKIESAVGLHVFSQALICSGAVGQPRDGRPGAQFGIFDRKNESMTFHCIAYDMARTVYDMESQGFPVSLVRRLVTGL